MSQNKPIIQIQGVEKSFILPNETVNAVKNCSFEIPEGSFTIIYGPSGSGKSTLLDAITGLELPTKGSVVFKGQNLNTLNADKRAKFRALNLGMVYQTNYWVSSLTVLDNVSMPLYLSGFTQRDARPHAIEALKKVRVEHLAKQRPGVLSTGEQQRVSMARALISNPEVIVADEPTGNLDTSNGDTVMSLLSTLNKDFGKTIVLVTHNLEYLPFSTYRVQMKDGVATISEGVTGLSSETKQKLSQLLHENSMRAPTAPTAPTLTPSKRTRKVKIQ